MIIDPLATVLPCKFGRSSWNFRPGRMLNHHHTTRCDSTSTSKKTDEAPVCKESSWTAPGSQCTITYPPGTMKQCSCCGKARWFLRKLNTEELCDPGIPFLGTRRKEWKAGTKQCRVHGSRIHKSQKTETQRAYQQVSGQTKMWSLLQRNSIRP